MKGYILVLTTVPEESDGERIARALLKERLAACVTISAASHSLYRWEKKIARDRERVLFIKTRGSLYPELERRIKEIHPYQVPEVIALSLCRGSSDYLDWVAKETKS